jgi:DNA gyrase subunit B
VYQKGRRKSNTYLLITEGDSAKGLFLQARKPHKHAIYPLRGKILNAVSADDIDVVAGNKILFELSTILGLSLTDPDISKCRYNYIVSLTDADTDGASIHGLLMGFLYTYWPDLFEERRVLRLLPPSHIDVTKKDRKHYYGKPPEHIEGKLEYIKGLASLTIEDVKSILEKPMYEIMIPDEMAKDTIDLVLGKSAEKRRAWLGQ